MYRKSLVIICGVAVITILGIVITMQYWPGADDKSVQSDEEFEAIMAPIEPSLPVIDDVLVPPYSMTLRAQFPVILHHFEEHTAAMGLPGFGAFVLAAHHSADPGLIERLAELLDEAQYVFSENIDIEKDTSRARMLYLLDNLLQALPHEPIVRACALVAKSDIESYSVGWMRSHAQQGDIPIAYFRAAQGLPDGFVLEDALAIISDWTAWIAAGVLAEQVLPIEILDKLLEGEEQQAHELGKRLLLSEVEQQLSEADLTFLDVEVPFHDGESQHREYLQSLSEEERTALSAYINIADEELNMEELRRQVVRNIFGDIEAMAQLVDGWEKDLLGGQWVSRVFNGVRASILQLTESEWNDITRREWNAGNLSHDSVHRALYVLGSISDWDEMAYHLGSTDSQLLQVFVQGRPRVAMLPDAAPEIANVFLVNHAAADPVQRARGVIRELQRGIAAELQEYAGTEGP